MNNGHEPLRLNIGSGNEITMKGYVNLDAKYGDVAFPLKYDDGSVDEIYASHILEHFSFRQTLDVLKDWVRVLKPGGILKIAVPDFALIAKAYVANGYHVIADGYVYGSQTDENEFHKAIFDEQKLWSLMEQAGLGDIQRWQSEVKDCAALSVSLNLMGKKPQILTATGAIIAEENRRAIEALKARHKSLYTLEDASIDPRFEVFAKSIKPTNIYSQFGEDGAIEAIFERIGIENKWCVECGAGDGLFFSNTRRLIEQGWKSVQIEADSKFYYPLKLRYRDNPNVTTVQATVGLHEGSRLDDVLSGYGLFNDSSLPLDFDLLVLDIDGQEWHVLNSLEKFRPRVLIVEFDPTADPMYIPEPNAAAPPPLNQAGRQALSHVCAARGYEVICRTHCNLICVRRDIAHLLTEEYAQVSREAFRQVLEATRDQGMQPLATINGKRFVSGAWRDETEVVKDNVTVNVAIAMSTPRIGYLDSADIITEIALAVRARRGRGFGVYWHHSLSRCIKQILDDEDADIDVIVTADYDTFARPSDLVEMIRLLYENPSIDAVIPVQSKRVVTDRILIGTDGPIDWSKALSPATTGHFGLTVFRRRVFERMRKPWFWEKPDANGDWGEGRVDADIGFWHNFNDSGLKAALATGVMIGHREEVVTVPKIENGKISKVYIAADEWLKRREEAAIAETVRIHA